MAWMRNRSSNPCAARSSKEAPPPCFFSLMCRSEYLFACWRVGSVNLCVMFQVLKQYKQCAASKQYLEGTPRRLTTAPPTPTLPCYGRVPRGFTWSMGAFRTKSDQCRGISSARTTGSVCCISATCGRAAERGGLARRLGARSAQEGSPLPRQQLGQLHCPRPPMQRGLRNPERRRRGGLAHRKCRDI